MKLYYSAGSCSTSCHILLEEGGFAYTAIQPNWDQPDEHLAEMNRLNVLEVTPVLVLENGRVMTQNLAIFEYLDSQKPGVFYPKSGTWERAQALSWASFVASDLHKTVGLFFALKGMAPQESAQADLRKYITEKTTAYLDFLNQHLEAREYLMGTQFTAADAYCFVVLRWLSAGRMNLEGHPNLAAYMARMKERPAVQRALKAEGLMK